MSDGKSIKESPSRAQERRKDTSVVETLFFLLFFLLLFTKDITKFVDVVRPHSKGRFVSERDRNKVLYTRCCTQNPANRTKKKERKEQVSRLFDSKGTLQEYGIGFFSSSSFAAFRPVEEKETCSSSFGGRTSKDIHILSARMQRFADFGLGIDRAQCSLYTHQQEESVTLKDSADYWTGRKSRVDECALPRRHRVEQFFYDIKKGTDEREEEPF